MAAAKPETPLDPRDFVVTRVIAATPAQVFRAWTEPAALAQWFGPRTFTTHVTAMDVRPGGAWRVVMRSPDGVDYPLKGTYLDVVPSSRLVYTDDWEEHPPEWHAVLQNAIGAAPPPRGSLVTVTFEAEGAKTRLTLRVHFASAVVRDAMAKMGMDEVWPDNIGRLEAVAQHLSL